MSVMGHKRDSAVSEQCPLYPRKRTSPSAIENNDPCIVTIIRPKLRHEPAADQGARSKRCARMIGDVEAGSALKKWEQLILLSDGRPIFVRPVRPDDDELFRNFAKGLSAVDARQRFFVPKKELSDADLDRLVHINYGRAMAFVGIQRQNDRCRAAARGV